MQSIENLSTKLLLNEDGIWVSNNQSDVSYPDQGNETCRQIEDHSFWFKHRNNCIIAAMHLHPPSGAILDIGGGNGFVSITLKQAGFESILLEPGIQGISNAVARGLSPVIHSTLQDADIKPNSVSGAGLFDVLEHIENDVMFLKEIEKILEFEGKIYLTVPAYNFLHSDEDDEAGHYRRYTVGSLSKCVKEAGFEIEFVSYIFSILPIPILLFRTLPSMFFRRRKKRPMSINHEHKHPPSIFGKILQIVLTCELWLIMKQIFLPIGGSCLLIARKRK